MQVTETKSEGLKREFKIQVPADTIESKVDSRIRELAQTARMPGFRPGKVPPKLLRKKYGPSVLGEILEQTVNESSNETMNERGLRPAEQPEIEITSFDEGQDLEYTMAVEVMPEIEPIDFGKIKLERLNPEIDEGEVESALQRLAEAHKDSKPVTSKRKSKKGDIAVIDFVGKIDGEEFAGGQAEDYHLELGSGSFIPGFEDQLIGVTKDTETQVTVDFPEDYGAADLAGKQAVFDVTVKELRESAPAEIDDELAKKVGMDSLEDLKKAIREEQEKEYKSISRTVLKRQLLDQLADGHDFEVPEKMVEREYDSIWQQYQQHIQSGGEEDEEDKNKSEEEKQAEFREMAERRVRLGLLLGEIGRTNNIQVGQEEITRALMNEARRYPGQEQQVMELFQQNQQMMEQVTAPLYEDKVVDFIVEMADVSDKTVSAEDLVKKAEEPDKPAAKKKAPAKKKSSGSKAKSGGSTAKKSTSTAKEGESKGTGTKKTAAKKSTASSKKTTAKKDEASDE